MRTPAPSYSPLKNNKGSINQTTRHLPIKGTIYISEVLTDKDGIETFDVKANRRSMTQYGESWETAYIEEDWRNRHDRLQPFVDWIVDGSAVTTASQLKDLTGYLRQYLCTSVETTKKDEDETSFDVTKVGAAIDRRDTLEEKFGFFKAGKGTSKDAKETKQLLIVVEVDLQKWQAARKKVQADRAAREVADRTAKEAEGRARRAIEYRRQQQLDQEENRRWEREALAARRDEVVDRDNDAVPVKPEWLLAEVDPNNPPELIDLSSPRKIRPTRVHPQTPATDRSIVLSIEQQAKRLSLEYSGQRAIRNEVAQEKSPVRKRQTSSGEELSELDSADLLELPDPSPSPEKRLQNTTSEGSTKAGQGSKSKVPKRRKVINKAPTTRPEHGYETRRSAGQRK